MGVDLLGQDGGAEPFAFAFLLDETCDQLAQRRPLALLRVLRRRAEGGSPADLFSGGLRRNFEALLALTQPRQLSLVELALASMEGLLTGMEGLPLLMIGDLRLEIAQHLRYGKTWVHRCQIPLREAATDPSQASG
jgi:hypothetical protein